MTTTKEDRELDAWIAEHVMGWRLRGHIPSYWERDASDEICFLGEVGNQDDECLEWRPSQYPAQAMEVLAKCAVELSPDGGGRAIAIEWQGDVQESWMVCETDVVGIQAEAPTLPLAIAKFAKSLFSKKAEGGE